MPEDYLPPIVDRLYGAALEPSLWEDFLRQVMKDAQAPCATIFVHRFDEPGATIDLFPGVDAEHKRLFETYYFKCNSWMAASEHRMFESSVFTGEEVLHSSELVRTEYYADYLRHIEIFHAINVCLWRSHDAMANLTLFRPKGTPFEKTERTMLSRLYPHVRRALEIHRRTTSTGVLERTLNPVERLNACAMLVDERGEVVYANSRAEQFLIAAEFLTVRNGRLQATTIADSASLTSCLRRATDWRGNSRDGGTVNVRSWKSQRRVTTHVIPFISTDLAFLSAQHRVALVLIDDRSAQLSDATALRASWGLTDAEAKLALLLTRGASLSAIAEMRQVSIHTVRTQIKSIFMKTGTHSQAELVRIMLLDDSCRSHDP
jgi:DNA-binding CsgD family transcriptional regulator